MFPPGFLFFEKRRGVAGRNQFMLTSVLDQTASRVSNRSSHAAANGIESAYLAVTEESPK
jgi:hypothetical protein